MGVVGNDEEGKRIREFHRQMGDELEYVREEEGKTAVITGFYDTTGMKEEEFRYDDHVPGVSSQDISKHADMIKNASLVFVDASVEPTALRDLRLLLASSQKRLLVDPSDGAEGAGAAGLADSAVCGLFAAGDGRAVVVGVLVAAVVKAEAGGMGREEEGLAEEERRRGLLRGDSAPEGAGGCGDEGIAAGKGQLHSVEDGRYGHCDDRAGGRRGGRGCGSLHGGTQLHADV